MASIIVTTPPAVEPLTLAEVKLQLGYGPFEDSDHVTSSNLAIRLRNLIIAAREYCEMFTRRAFITTGFTQFLDSFPYYTDTIMSQQAYPPAYYSLPRYSTTLWNYSQMIKLFYSPVQSVPKIIYISSATSQPEALTLGYPSRFPLSPYTVGENITDSNGNIQTCTQAGSTGSGDVTWPTAAAATTTDGTVIWTCTGQVAPVSQYIIDTSAEPARIFPVAGQFWPSVLYVPNAVQISFNCGYGNTAASVPARVKVAMRMLIQMWDKSPELMAQKSFPAIDRLLWSLRVLDLAPTRG